MNKVYLKPTTELTPVQLDIIIPGLKRRQECRFVASSKNRSITINLSNGNTSIVFLGAGVSAEVIIDDE